MVPAVEVVTAFNDRITARDLDGLAALMTDDHAFVDAAGAGVHGRSACVAAWDRFFAAFPDYRNVFASVTADGAEVVVVGHSICAEPALAGRALWTATVAGDRVRTWRVHADTAGNRPTLGLSTLDAELAGRFPVLFAPQHWPWGDIDALFSTAAPPDDLVTDVHVIGFVGDRIVVCRDDRDEWFPPGGTRERGETVARCVDRQLLEEAGARLGGPLRLLGAHHAHSVRPAPWRPHQPHPDMFWLWCVADVKVVGAPTVPTGGEKVVETRVVEAGEAARLLAGNQGYFADLVPYAVERRAAPLIPPAPA